MKVKTLLMLCFLWCSMSMIGQNVLPNEKVQEAMSLDLFETDSNDIEFLNFRSSRSYEVVELNTNEELPDISSIRHKVTNLPLTQSELLSPDFNILLYEVIEQSGPVTLFSIEGTTKMMRFINETTQIQLYERSKKLDSKIK